MPQKGHYAAGVCVLFEQAVDIEDVIASLREFDLVGRAEDPEPGAWMFGGPSVAIAYKPEANGLVVVDAVNHPWPDSMGDPKKAPMIFGAWSMGHFGPFTFPDGLSRATQQSWVWADGKSVAEKQKSFVRIRVGYAFGDVPDDTPLLPEEYDAADELQFITKVAAALLDMPGAICLFNPNGELLRDSATLADALSYAEENELPALDAWCNVRLANASDGWLVMDTIGNQQLDLPDIEVCLHKDKGYDLSGVDGFLRDVTHYLLENGEVIQPGDTMDGVGTTWRFVHRKNGILMPPRPTLRAFPPGRHGAARRIAS